MPRALWCAMLLLGVGCGAENDPNDGAGGGGLFDLFDELAPDRDDYVFLEGCPMTEDLDACSACCEAEGFDRAAVFGSDCGCQSTETDDVVCTPAANGEQCGSCCSDNGYESYFFIGDDTGGDCSCMRASKEPQAGP